MTVKTWLMMFALRFLNFYGEALDAITLPLISLSWHLVQFSFWWQFTHSTLKRLNAVHEKM